RVRLGWADDRREDSWWCITLHGLQARKSGSGSRAVESSGRAEASLRGDPGQGVVGDHPGLQRAGGSEKIYITRGMIVKMIDPALEGLALRGGVLPAGRPAVHLEADFIRREAEEALAGRGRCRGGLRLVGSRVGLGAGEEFDPVILQLAETAEAERLFG